LSEDWNSRDGDAFLEGVGTGAGALETSGRGQARRRGLEALSANPDGVCDAEMHTVDTADDTFGDEPLLDAKERGVVKELEVEAKGLSVDEFAESSRVFLRRVTSLSKLESSPRDASRITEL
jgi:hypothetical protein